MKPVNLCYFSCLIRLRLAVLLLCVMLPAGQAYAANRALLVGVGNYEIAQANLNGIGIDIEEMKRAAALLGYREGEIRVLQDREATLGAVRRALREWLVEGVEAGDNVLFYFSGHGTRIDDLDGDEADGADEVLGMRDMAIVERDGKPWLEGVLVDDEFNQLLNRIPSENVLVLVDACHSGTATKSLGFDTLQFGTRRPGTDGGQEKRFQYAGMPSGDIGQGYLDERARVDRFIGISASGDGERAIATVRGSLFTLGIVEHIQAVQASDGTLTASSLRIAAAQYITQRLGSGHHLSYEPRLNGDRSRDDRPIPIVRFEPGNGPNWKRLERLVGSMKRFDQPRTDRSTYRVLDKIHVTVEIPKKGYLNLVRVDSRDNARVLFPNGYRRDNAVRPGTLRIPGDMGFRIHALDPFGPTLLVAIFSEEPFDLYATGDGLRDDSGAIMDRFAQLSGIGLYGYTKAIRTEVGRENLMGAKIEFTVNP